jgi:hypothetical protein
MKSRSCSNVSSVLHHLAMEAAECRRHTVLSSNCHCMQQQWQHLHTDILAQGVSFADNHAGAQLNPSALHTYTVIHYRPCCMLCVLPTVCPPAVPG